jgi:tetratricopeptide (TPR) repeat protein
MNLDDKLAQGIAAAESGRKQEARTLLTEVVQADESRLAAWLWLSQVVDSLDDKTVCLENALILEPAHEFAQAELAQVKVDQEKLFRSTYVPGEEEPPPMVVPPLEPMPPFTAVYPHEANEFDDPWRCPFCFVPTQPKDTQCPHCRQQFIVKRRLQKERTFWLWRGFFLQFTLAFMLTIFGVGYFFLAAKLTGVGNPLPLLPAYLGQPVTRPDAHVTVMLAFYPLWLLGGLAAAALYSLLLMLMLYFRVPNGHIVYLINAGLMLALGFFGAVFNYTSMPAIVAAIVVLGIGALQLLITMNLWYDFTFEQGRLQLKFDRGATNHTTAFISGRKYSELGMWGLAVIHLRRAVSKEPNKFLYNIALAVAYMNTKRYDLARDTLDCAEKLEPASDKVSRLRAELAARTQPPG